MFVDSPAGKPELVARETKLVAILWENDRKSCKKLGEMRPAEDKPVLLHSARQLREYFAGERTGFAGGLPTKALLLDTEEQTARVTA